MKTSNRVIRVYKRNWLGMLVCIAKFDAYSFEAIISTQGALRISPLHKERSVHAAFAAGEWSVVDKFNFNKSVKVN